MSLRMSYHGPMLSNGEEVGVTVLSNYGAVLDLTVLSGAHADWNRTEDDGLHSAYFAACAGGLLALLAIFFWLRPATTTLGDG